MIGAKRKAESGLLATEDLVQQALREAEAQKAAKKQQKDPTGDWGEACFKMLCFKQCLTLAYAACSGKEGAKGQDAWEIEADEGGVVKESLVGMAQTKRAAQRKQAHIEGTLYRQWSYQWRQCLSTASGCATVHKLPPPAPCTLSSDESTMAACTGWAHAPA